MPTKYQTLCSYLYEVLLETASSPYNPYLEVVLSRGRVRLNTENITYSYEDLCANYYTAFEQLHVRQRQLANVLVLGFGLGSVPIMLQRNFGQNARYVGVDIDAIVLQLAHKYMPKAVAARTTLHCADAYTWVQTHTPPNNGYELIAVDIFIGKDTPSPFCSPDFLQSVERLLTPQDGIIVYNALADTPEQKLKAQHFYDTVFSATFAQSFVIPTASNLMLVAVSTP